MVSIAQKSFHEAAEAALEDLYAGRIADDFKIVRVAWGVNAGATRVLWKAAEQTRTTWLVQAVAVWVGIEHHDDDQDEPGLFHSRYRQLLRQWPSLSRYQTFVLQRHGRGANLFARGGFNETEDETLTLHLIQEFSYADVPWGDHDQIEIMATMEPPSDAWVLFTPSEY
jgi:hypothetical protein